MASKLKQCVNELYTGASPAAVRFRYVLILFDAATILFFIITAPIVDSVEIHAINTVVGLFILADFSARLWIAPNRREMLTRIYTLADIVVIIVLVLDPFLSHSLAFLRILRGLRLIHSYQLLGDLRRDSRFFRVHEDAVIAATNLIVFVFLTASVVYTMFFADQEGSGSYIDALYFTVATLTTTGFGDITLDTTGGKLFSVFIMVIGVALFVQLAKAVFQPQKVHYTCKGCGLMRHDTDAVHCKHCGERLQIRTVGID